MENSSKRCNVCLQNLLFLLLPCLFFFIQYHVVPVTGDVHVTPYIPVESITIDCGSSMSGQSLDGRPWVGDVGGQFIPIEQSNNKNKSSAVNLESQLPVSVGSVPYSTARLSYSEFTYSIPLTTGPKFIRFYFYPTSYPGFAGPSNKAFFSVKAGPFTLISNFSALLFGRGEPTLVNEFSVNVHESQGLNITFTPRPDITDSYAFINGIEVVDMPTNLYYGPSIIDGVNFLGQAQAEDTALEMMYRINVGGMEEDTGVFQHWLSDVDYLTIAKPSALLVNTANELTFSGETPSFSAPRVVYLTARTMGTNKTGNENYNLTWEFPVDSGFNYFVRLHFCEFQSDRTQQGDRVFEIFLANLTAEIRADVMAWSGGHGIPVYKDYVVPIGSQGNQKQQNLSIALHPSPASTSRSSDAILNGLEIFKLRKNFVLAGPNLEQGNTPQTSTKPDKSTRTIIVAVVAPISGIVMVSLLLFLIFQNCSNNFANNSIPAPPSDICRRFSLREIKTATNNFDKSFIVGRGGFGNMYKGFTEACSTLIAIKRLNPSSQQGVLEFRTEIKMLSKLRHQNLVSLIGYCEDNKEIILVYDYMLHGTLRDHLYNTNNPPLQWEQRLKMCIGAAHGLHYLHRGPNHTIIHRDVKTTNILLNEKWVAKVSDFGLSKMNDLSNTHISTAVKGSFGYLDPEYYRLQKLTEKSDVYSFGVVLCEVLCARLPIDRTSEDHMQISLAEWAQHCYNNGSLDQIIDPYLQGKISLPSQLKFVEVAISCLASEGMKRPTMSEVVYGLELALQLRGSEMNGNDENDANNSSNVDYHVLYTSGSGSMRVGR
ncbi:putative Malectin/receptor-like protein kinase family protein [Hibiscus syriacus]|uniref:Malectin/receptor-like protein kinase family protein n=1 Tax=Hibiscus syriacus TaxID=106335 RepID=A0A6A3ABK6_HIBSY|nr:receptor-like protein kinase FERONIA [Hibiscus syriacus]KAE8701323.1 putative Malectin/receptor-like protein kinase family protein [Hibiscus syriacus]